MIDPLGGPAYWVPFLIGFVIAYPIGSIPFGLLLAKAGGAGDVAGSARATSARPTCCAPAARAWRSRRSRSTC